MASPFRCMVSTMSHTVAQPLSRSIKSVGEVRAELYRRGQTVRGLAQELGVSERVLHELLRGRLRGRWGQAHRAAVLLGLKEGEVQ